MREIFTLGLPWRKREGNVWVEIERDTAWG